MNNPNQRGSETQRLKRVGIASFVPDIGLTGNVIKGIVLR